MMIISNTPLYKMKGAGPKRKKPGACLLQAPGWVVPAKPMRGVLHRPGMFTANQDLAIKSKAIIIVRGKQSSHKKISSHSVKAIAHDSRWWSAPENFLRDEPKSAGKPWWLGEHFWKIPRKILA
ncbi:hypothetical protein [Allofournierella massiliensis]|uniref:hypothetical protein n=1 Tax=Allofournierella massiliensis TaxID=1650663 RepID=UPI0025A319FC|nr:hypothetical protein [Fournierella massiliensis]